MTFSHSPPRRTGLLASALALAGGFFVGSANAQTVDAKTINGLTPRAYVEQMFADCFTHPTQPLRLAVDKYLTPDAIHYADGKPVTREDHIHHLEYLQKNMKAISFDIQQVTYDGEWLAERHLGSVTLPDGKAVGSEVVVFFHILNGKVDRSFEITRPISGDESDRAVHTAK